MPSPRRRWPLTRYFAVVSTIAMLVLGCALILTTGTVMRQQALREGAAAAQSVAQYAGASLPQDVYTLGLLAPEQHELVAQSVTGFSDRLVGLRLWTRDGGVLYDSDAAATGFPDWERLDAALRGTGDARVITEVHGDALGGTEREVLNVYVPSRVDGVVAGAAEVRLDYTGTAQALASASRLVTYVVVGGLALLWILLFRTVRTTSKRLQSSALDNARLALLDSLTGLPNRRMLADRLHRAIETAHADGTRVGLVLLDVDRFKDINDSLGHDRGDELLEQVATRLRECLRDGDLVARLGGDEFAVLLPGVRSPADAEQLAHRVRGVFAAPFPLGDLPLHVDTSIGVAVLPDHAQDGTTLMRMADVAMYTAKTHRLGVALYSPDEDDSSPARLVLLGDLHRALAASAELEMHYQPKVDLLTGETVGLEALMRWRHPTRGLLPPDLFVPLAEQSGLIHDLTGFALRACVEQIARWRTHGPCLPVAVNLSAHDLTEVTVVELIESLLEEHSVPPELLEVEITETALVADPSRVVPVLRRLADAGVRVAIDDFGIGNTSISQLLDLPVAVLKIDRLFVTDLATGGGSALVVKAMVDLAHSFGLSVVAEGVEDEETAALLRGLQVDQAQGFWYSAARPPSDLAADGRMAARISGRT
ncbi:putative bifunctional diguanylate cyclase/phosphodiesterase [Cellulomonas timonensis]|uniref:putative bifunctional diguanylate cyclase/phosphodiesterase n=1 Tax=Cellulomonas timonensis TaxID=1689271 RepID=UPI000A88A26F|nr:EAL domain-containing protein [Cellulomonas timonensis]